MKRIFTLLSIILATAFQSNAQLVINEVDYDQPSTDVAEYIELYNAGSTAVTLSDYQLILFNGSPAVLTTYKTIALSGTLAAGDYYVIGTAIVPNVDLVLSSGAQGFIENGASAGATGSPDGMGIQQISSGTIVDALSYEGDCPAPWIEGTGLTSANSDTLTSDSVAYKYLSIGRYTDGTDSNNNNVDFTRMCGTPGVANVNTVTNCVVTGIAKVDNKLGFEVYPNPTKGMLNVDFSNGNLKEVSIVLTDILGKEVRRISLGDFNAVYQLDMTSLHNGFYFVKVLSAKGESAQRVMLAK
jgi:hypothetical protein